MYPLAAFVVLICMFQVNYLNKALEHFSASIVTPLNFVFFSFATLLTTSILYQGFAVSTPVVGITLLLGFLVIVIGVILLFQYNLKVINMKLSRHIEDVNDEEVDDNHHMSDNPFVMLNRAYPIHPESKKHSNTVAPTIDHRQIDEKDEIYVRMEEQPSIEETQATALSPIQPNVPKVSLSEQIQQRDEINNQQRNVLGEFEQTEQHAMPHQLVPIRSPFVPTAPPMPMANTGSPLPPIPMNSNASPLQSMSMNNNISPLQPMPMTNTAQSFPPVAQITSREVRIPMLMDRMSKDRELDANTQSIYPSIVTSDPMVISAPASARSSQGAREAKLPEQPKGLGIAHLSIESGSGSEYEEEDSVATSTPPETRSWQPPGKAPRMYGRSYDER